MAQSFHHLAIRAADIEASLRFYRDGLGCTPRYEFSNPGRIDRAVFLDIGDGGLLEIFGPASLVQADGRPRRAGEDATEGALLHLCLRVPDVDAAYARAMAAGAASRQEPRDVTLKGTPPAPVRAAFVDGPNGEVIEFLASDAI